MLILVCGYVLLRLALLLTSRLELCFKEVDVISGIYFPCRITSTKQLLTLRAGLYVQCLVKVVVASWWWLLCRNPSRLEGSVPRPLYSCQQSSLIHFTAWILTLSLQLCLHPPWSFQLSA